MEVLQIAVIAALISLSWAGLGALARALSLTRLQTLAWLLFLGWLFGR